MRVGQYNHAGRRLIAYNVYHAPDGCDESYLGRVTSLRAARRLAASGAELPASLYDTARAAGHCAGLTAPDKACEDGEATAWFGRGGHYCAVCVWDGPDRSGMHAEDLLAARADYDVYR